MSSRFRKILNLPRTAFKSAVSLATFPGKYKHQNHRIWLLEQALSRSESQIQALSAHMPTILNYVTSFAHTSRELTKNNIELQRSLNDSVSELWKRLEFVRREILYEFMNKTNGRGLDTQKLEQKIVNTEKFASMGTDVRVNIGCGHIIIEDYLNVDNRELPGVDVVSDVTDMPFSENTIGELFSSHLIEHFPQEQFRHQLLPYWYSLLKPGGIFRALLPDWESMIEKFSEGSFPFDYLREVTFGAQEYDGDFHFNMFSKESLTSALEAAGFRDISFPVTGRVNGKCEEMEVRASK